MSLTDAVTISPPTAPDVDPLGHLLYLRRDALARGHTDRSLARGVRAGTIERVRHGGYVDTPDWVPLDPRDRHGVLARAVLRQASAELVLSHTSAALEHGAPEWAVDLRTVHVTRLDQRAGRVEAGVHQHQGQLLPEDVVRVRGVPVTSPTRTVLDATKLLSQEAALCQLNFFLHLGLTNPEELERRYQAMAHDPFTRGTGILLKLADARIENVAESRTCYLMWRFGVPASVPQYEVRDEHGIVIARLDFAWPELGRWLEFDGRQKYLKPFRPGDDAAAVVVREKDREDLIRRLTGWRCLRITWRDLEDPVATARRICAFLAAA